MTPISRREFNAKAQAGLTLIEVLIAMALLSFISIAIYQATVRAFEVNFKLGSESADYTAIALSLQSVESDLAQIYSPLITSEAKPDMNEQPTEYWSPRLRADGLRRTRLRGTAERISFVTNNNRRIERDTPQSDFQKVLWEIERNESGAYTLYRTTNWDVFELEEQRRAAPPRVALLENLTSAKFSYYRLSNKSWEDQWDSEGSYTKSEERFPDLISLKIEVPDPTNNANTQSWEIVVKPNMPLNPVDAKKREEQKQRFLD